MCLLYICWGRGMKKIIFPLHVLNINRNEEKILHFFFCLFFRTTPWHMKVPRLGVELEL